MWTPTGRCPWFLVPLMHMDWCSLSYRRHVHHDFQDGAGQPWAPAINGSSPSNSQVIAQMETYMMNLYFKRLDRIVTRGRLCALRGNAAFRRAIITHWWEDWNWNSVAAAVTRRSYMSGNLGRALLTSGGASNRVPRSSHVRNLLPTSTGTEPPPLGQSWSSDSQKKKIQVWSRAVWR